MYLPKQEKRGLLELTHANVSPSSTVYEAAEALTAGLFARLPRLDSVKVELCPNDIRLHGLQSAKFALLTTKSFSRVELITQGIMRFHSGSFDESIEFSFRTVEMPGSHKDPIETKAQESQSEIRELYKVHPTFLIHEEFKRWMKIFASDLTPEATALHLAKLGFELADKQYGDKRLFSTAITFREPRNLNTNSRWRCRITLDRVLYEQSQASTLDQNSEPQRHRAFVALGSNVGNRISIIESACREMKARAIRVTKTSALYETKAMYLENQQSFINGACEVDVLRILSFPYDVLIAILQIETSLKPIELLDALKEIETHLGRVKTIENGPRNIDLDILMYDNERVDNDRLVIPHKRMLEREFVLRPLCE